MSGKVYLIGAGPGDPDLITVKGLHCLEISNCIIYDYLVNTNLLKHAPPTAEFIHVGKKGGEAHISQEQINALIVEKASSGLTVARLKGGDPFIFGRGGEEAAALAEAGIRFEVVPGITSGYAVPAYAGIPVTHRGLSPAVTFITGHEDPAKEESFIDWEWLSVSSGTLVFFMGVKNLPEIVENLLRFGKNPSTPIALIRWGTYLRQEALTGTLESIVTRVRSTGFTSPAIIVVGEVVQLRQQLKWFETRPLFGKRILITRPQEQAEPLRAQLAELGAEVILFPTVEIKDPATWQPLDEAIQHIKRYHWLIFTSVNGVENFFARFKSVRKDIRDLGAVKIAAIGPATEKAIRRFVLDVEIIPDEFRAENLVESLKGKVMKGSRVLIPRAKIAREVLPDELRKQGAQVDVVEAYQTIIPRTNRGQLEETLEEQPLDMVIFTSSSTVSNLAEIVRPATLPEVLEKTAVAAIGPITAQAAERLGLKVSVQPGRYTVPALVGAIAEYYRK